MFVSDNVVFVELQKTGCTHIRNLLMEPAINDSLAANYDLDLTPALFKDEGWGVATGNASFSRTSALPLPLANESVELMYRSPVDLYLDEGAREVTVADTDPELEDLTRVMRRRYPPLFESHPLTEVRRTGRPELIVSLGADAGGQLVRHELRTHAGVARALELLHPDRRDVRGLPAAVLEIQEGALAVATRGSAAPARLGSSPTVPRPDRT